MTLELTIFFSELSVGKGSCALSEELLLTFPVVCLLSSPSKSVKVVATDFLSMLEKVLVEKFVSRNNESMIEDEFPPTSSPGSVVFRLLQHIWYQVGNFFFFFFRSVPIWSYRHVSTSIQSKFNHQI